MFGYQPSDYDRRVYEEELLPFLPDRMVDAHTHIWREEFCEQENRRGCVSWTQLVAADNTAEDLLATYRDLFPGIAVTPVLMGQPCADLAATNPYTAESAARYSLPALYCTDWAMTPEQIERDVAAGGFLGLKPYLNNCPSYLPPNEVRIFDFLPHEHLALADRHGWIVMLHIPRPARLKDPVNLAQLLEIEQRYPNIKLIVAHIGRAYVEDDIGDAFSLLGKTERMLFDFTANTLDAAMTACLRAVGPGRLMFGSDLPITKMRMYRTEENGSYVNVVPRGLYGDLTGEPHMRETDEPELTCFLYEELLAFRRSARQLALTPAEVRDVLYTNAARLFGLPETP